MDPKIPYEPMGRLHIATVIAGLVIAGGAAGGLVGLMAGSLIHWLSPGSARFVDAPEVPRLARLPVLAITVVTLWGFGVLYLRTAPSTQLVARSDALLDISIIVASVSFLLMLLQALVSWRLGWEASGVVFNRMLAPGAKTSVVLALRAMLFLGAAGLFLIAWLTLPGGPTGRTWLGDPSAHLVDPGTTPLPFYGETSLAALAATGPPLLAGMAFGLIATIVWRISFGSRAHIPTL